MHKELGWTPSRDHIRPSPEVIAQKALSLEQLQAEYEDEHDFILVDVFGFEATVSESGRKVVDKTKLVNASLKVFTSNHFPYSLPEGTKHYVMWYSCPREETNDLQINKDIVAALRDHCNHNRYGVRAVGVAVIHPHRSLGSSSYGVRTFSIAS